MKFKDLEFNNQMHGGVGATAKFNDIMVSIQASSNHYCTPREDGLCSWQYSSFEVAIFDKEEWVTSKFIENADMRRCLEDVDDVSGWTSRETIEQLLEDLSNHNATQKFDREIYNIILVHVARTWERFRVVQNHQEMPLDNIQSAEELPNIAQKILENKVVQEFLINKDGSVWDKFGDGCSDTFIERISREYIIANYFFTIKNI